MVHEDNVEQASETNSNQQGCFTCLTRFKPTYDCQKYCSVDCRKIGYSKNRKTQHDAIACLTCKNTFLPKRKGRKYCSHECYGKRHANVVKSCVVCSHDFTVAFRFRETLTCSRVCLSKHKSNILSTCVTKTCLMCQTPFKTILSSKEKSKYCTYDCFLSSRKTRQPDVVKKCESCMKEFVTSYVRNKKRFCSKQCSVSGKFNPTYGKPGVMLGKQAWNRGLTTETDSRVRDTGFKVSCILKEQFRSGVRNHHGENNPNFGNTADVISREKRENFSRAAVKRVLAGQSGYKTGHLTGDYTCSKSSSTIRVKSSWELAMVMTWEIDQAVQRIEYEPEVIVLNDGRRAIPDFVVYYVDGSKKMFEIKPTMIQHLPSVKEKLDQVRQIVESRGIDYVLVGDDIVHAAIDVLGKAFQDEINRIKSGK